MIDILEIAGEVREEVSKQMVLKDGLTLGKVIKERGHDDTHYIDIIAEDALAQALKRRKLSCIIVSEEYGTRTFSLDTNSDVEFTLIFDPIDGSTNAISGIPFFSSALAYSDKVSEVGMEDVSQGVVTMYGGETFYGIKGEGMFINGEHFTARPPKRRRPIISVYSYGPKLDQRCKDALQDLQEEFIIRTFGSVSLDLCYLAAGRIDGFIDLRGGLNAYDVMASMVLLYESGGVATDVEGRSLNLITTSSKFTMVAARDPSVYVRLIDKFQK